MAIRITDDRTTLEIDDRVVEVLLQCLLGREGCGVGGLGRVLAHEGAAGQDRASGLSRALAAARPLAARSWAVRMAGV